LILFLQAKPNSGCQGAKIKKTGKNPRTENHTTCAKTRDFVLRTTGRRLPQKDYPHAKEIVSFKL
jgi:hypothetical protein